MASSWESHYHLMLLNKIVSRHKSLSAAGKAWLGYLKKHGAAMRPELRGHPNLWVRDFSMENLPDVTNDALDAAEKPVPAPVHYQRGFSTACGRDPRRVTAYTHRPPVTCAKCLRWLAQNQGA
jgi:hypothetical protein